MFTTSEWCYGKGKDILPDLYEKEQPLILSGMAGKGRQTIFHDFDAPDVKKTLFTMTEELMGKYFQDSGFCPKNEGLLSNSCTSEVLTATIQSMV